MTGALSTMFTDRSLCWRRLEGICGVEQEVGTRASLKHPPKVLSALAPHVRVFEKLTLSHQPKVTRRA